MKLKCGIIGLPNVGKSTLFNAITSAGIEAENFPFCTIEPNQGIVPVPDERLMKISEIVGPESTIPATTEFVDIAGLVKGASMGEGLGNQFLSYIRETQAILHVVRCFDNINITHVHDEIDPISDIEIVEKELLLSDLETIRKAKLKVERESKSGDKEAHEKYKGLNDLERELNKGLQSRDLSFVEETSEHFQNLQLITMKPCLYVANVQEDDNDNFHLEKLKGYADSKGLSVLTLCNQIEAEIAELGQEEGLDILKEMGMKEPGLNKLIRKSYEMLHLQTFFSAEPKEVRAWTIKKGTTALQAAGEIHTDFEKGFIRAETVAYEDFIKHRGELGAKSAGKLRSEGSDYLVKDGDIIHFRFNV